MESTGALRDIKVIDLSRVLGGPFCAQILGDHGADVIKIEPPSGDETRGWGPPFREEDGAASYFVGLNRNKRGMSLDLRQEAGREVLLRLLEDADILVENFKIGTLEKWGFGRDVLCERFPRLIHCRVSGFGADGPLGALPGYDAILQAMGGLMSVNGEADGGPLRVGLPVVDMVTALNATIGIMMALRDRDATGKGQFVEATLFDSALSLLHPHAPNWFESGKKPVRTGNSHSNIVPYSSFRTATKPVFLGIGNNGQFAKLCAHIGVPELTDDPRFRTNGDRVRNREAMHEALEAALAGHDGPVLASELIAAGVPAGAIFDVDEALTQPHALHREMVVEIENGKGRYRGIGAPVKLDRAKASYRRSPPAFAEHAEEILREAGYGPDAIACLRASGAFGGPADAEDG